MNVILFISAVLCANEHDTASACVDRGMQAFRNARVEESLEEFRRAIAIEPRIEPYLWQRGISQYCLGQYDAGRKQFEIHKEVNPHDVENAAWHFLCVGKLKGQDFAQKQMMPIQLQHDIRVPMKEIYLMYAGKGSREKVILAAEREGTPRSRMYAHLYIGLQYEVAGDQQNAKKHLELAVEESLQDSYMQDVARICLGYCRGKERKKESVSEHHGSE